MLKQFLDSESGLETVEYSIISGLIVAGTLAIVLAVGDWVQNQLGSLQSDLGGGGGGGGGGSTGGGGGGPKK